MQMMKMKGSRQEIIQKWKEACEQIRPLNEREGEVFARLFDEMLEHSQDLSDDEAFVVLNEQFDPKHKFLTPHAEYFVSISSSTWFLCSLYIMASGNIGINILMQVFEKMAGVKLLKAPCLEKLEKKTGESCMMLEAAENRRKGIERDVLKKNRGECIHAYLDCNYMEAETGNCKCSSDEAGEILDRLAGDGLLVQRKKKYYYNDFI